jgi:phosphoglycolate phosphatase
MHLIFDLDGTLVDSRPGIQYAIHQAIHRVYPSYDQSALNVKIGPPIRAMLEKALSPISVTELDQLEAAFREIYDGGAWKMMNVYPGMRETIWAFHSDEIPCYVATNKPALATQRILAHVKISQFFADVLSPDSCQPTFSNKAGMISHLIKHHKFSPVDAIYIGDSTDDLQSADCCGVKFIGIEFGYGSLPLTGTFQSVQSFSGLLSLIQSKKQGVDG